MNARRSRKVIASLDEVGAKQSKRDCFVGTSCLLAMTVLALSAIGVSAFADEIRMKGGIKVNGIITEEKKDYVIIAIPGGGEFKIKKSDISSIEASSEEERKKLKEELGKVKGTALKNGRGKMNYGGERHSSADSIPYVSGDSKKVPNIGHVTAVDSEKRKETFSILQERRKAKVRSVTGISKKKARDEKK